MRTFKRLAYPIWTEHKARFIEQYLKCFVYVTRSGTYIDGFAGPQWYDRPEAWAAKLVLDSRPPLLKHFHLCEKNKRKLKMLERLRKNAESIVVSSRRYRRDIAVCPGDFNANVDTILKVGTIAAVEPTFCLLDQRTFECHWNTVKKLAAYKPAENYKIELFYFLATSWLPRSLSAVGREKAEKWWGSASWRELRRLSTNDIKDRFVNRFKSELNYKYVMAYPIYERKGSKRVMYFMIHASDHDEAPALMVRAYNGAVRALPKPQPKLWSD